MSPAQSHDIKLITTNENKKTKKAKVALFSSVTFLFLEVAEGSTATDFREGVICTTSQLILTNRKGEL